MQPAPRVSSRRTLTQLSAGGDGGSSGGAAAAAEAAAAGEARAASAASLVPLVWASRMDEEPQVVFTSAVHDPFSGCDPTAQPAAARRHAELKVERRRVVAAMRRAGLQLRRCTSLDGEVRYTCVVATEGRLMIEAHRLGMEKRLKVSCMPPAIHVGNGLLPPWLARLLRPPAAWGPTWSEGCATRWSRLQQRVQAQQKPPPTQTQTRAIALARSPPGRSPSARSPTSRERTRSRREAGIADVALVEAAARRQAAGAPAGGAGGDPFDSSRASLVFDAYDDDEEDGALLPPSTDDDGRMAYIDFDLSRWHIFEPHRRGELFFTPQERQRLLCSILSARPAVGGAGIDLSMLLAGKAWRVPLPPKEEEVELHVEAAAFGWSQPLPLRDLPKLEPPPTQLTTPRALLPAAVSKAVAEARTPGKARRAGASFICRP